MLLLNRSPKGLLLPIWAVSLFLVLILALAIGRFFAVQEARSLCPEQPLMQAIEAGECKEAKAKLAVADKLYPTWAAMGQGFYRNFIKPEKPKPDAPQAFDPLNSPMGKATRATLGRFLPGVAIAMALAFVLAMAWAASGYSRLAVGSFNVALAYVPAIALTPFFFSFPGDAFHVAMVAFAMTPVILRDLILHLSSLPSTLQIKAQTLHANTWTTVLRVLAPLTLPRLIDATRVSMGLGWILVLAAEFVIAREGIGLRIWKLKRRYDVDNLLPIVIWVTLLAILIDLLLWAIKRGVFPWSKGGRET